MNWKQTAILPPDQDFSLSAFAGNRYRFLTRARLQLSATQG